MGKRDGDGGERERKWVGDGEGGGERGKGRGRWKGDGDGEGEGEGELERGMLTGRAASGVKNVHLTGQCDEIFDHFLGSKDST